MGIGRVKTFIDVIELAPLKSGQGVTDHIVASMGAYREELHALSEEGRTSFQLRQIPGVEVKENMVLVCDTGRYRITEIKQKEDMYLEALVERD
ncbi:hypothetical protein F9B85_03435 [Heliorestis acidaminivorans]|uniref:Head-tail adaptor protein n=1 Tax=Heliorestis acidaminivorans TaxID=553427 RepID=A0A6I0EU14_9FIRM|nr:hypothetical protein [Heliorestis acidaminivorans]KAB2953684.1 hypothetical protein F9B85_03435 [Heliorestis acidaminivorans]